MASGNSFKKIHKLILCYIFENPAKLLSHRELENL